jgi:hypothetical protein
MGFQKKEHRGQVAGSRLPVGGWNPYHKPEFNEEREQHKRAIGTEDRSTLTEIQQKFARTTVRDGQLDCIRKAVELVFGFQPKPNQVVSLRCEHEIKLQF